MGGPIILAVDTTEVGRAKEWVEATAPWIGTIKLGLEFFLANGAAGVTAVRESAPELKLFLDLKLHDIPNTVAGAKMAPLAVDRIALSKAPKNRI